MSLRVRLTVALVALSVGSVGVVAVWTVFDSSARLRSDIDRSLDDALRSLTSAGGGPGRPGGPPGVSDGVPPGVRPREFDRILFQIITADGSVARASSQTPLLVDDEEIGAAGEQRTGVRVEREVELGGESFRQVTESLGDGRGAVQVARSRSELDRFVSRAVAGSVIAVLLVTIAASLVAAGLARQITRPLVELTRSAEHVAATGRLDVELPGDRSGSSTETGRLAAAFQSMLAALALSRGAQQRLVQDAGHELRTPLTSLRTNVALLRRSDELDAASRDAVVADLESETRELTELVDELVALAGDGAQNAQADGLADLIEVVMDVAYRAERRTGREIVVLDRTNADALVRVSRDALTRAVRNLVENAAKFDESDTPIEVSVMADDDQVAVEVADRGPGLAPVELERIFDRFYRTDAARSRPGSGLGLSIVAEVARGAGGTTLARHREGGGLIVGFAVPAIQLDEPRPGHG